VQRSSISRFASASVIDWPKGEGRNVVLADEVGVELGNPQMASTSALLWTENPDLVSDGKITLIGPDMPSSKGQIFPSERLFLFV